MLIFAMDQLIVLKGGGGTQRKCVEGRGRVGVDDHKIWDNKWGGEREKKKKKNKVTTD